MGFPGLDSLFRVPFGPVSAQPMFFTFVDLLGARPGAQEEERSRATDPEYMKNLPAVKEEAIEGEKKDCYICLDKVQPGQKSA